MEWYEWVVVVFGFVGIVLAMGYGLLKYLSMD